jgi:poly(hydroxyalkanoate) granule-associated protein
MDTTPNPQESVKEAGDRYQYPLTEMLRRVFLASVGAAAIAHEELEAMVDRLVERGEMAEKDGKTLIHEMKDKRSSRVTHLEDEIDRRFSSIMDRMNIPTKADVDALNAKIAELNRKLDELKNTSGGA